ncbi:MAG: hypothetical protein P8Y23_01940 [Candidatus Lokiarchaeota archaeon]
MNNRLELLKEIVIVQRSDGNWNYDPYNHGYANGLILAEAIMHDLEPRFLDAPKEWISERDGLVCSNEDLKILFFDSELSALVVFNRKVANSSSF